MTAVHQHQAATRGESGEDVASAFERTVDEGQQRLERTWPALLATGTIGGLDVGVGLLGLLIVRQQTGDPLLAALAFSIGFVALALANSELFTENFLVPIAAVAAGRSAPWRVGRLWLGTLAMNLVGGWAVMGLVIAAFPRLEPVAIDQANQYIELGIGTEAFASALLGGMVITLMTWMQHSTQSVPAKLIAVIGAAFLLAAGPLNHAIVGSLEMFGALHAGAPFGYLDWLGWLGWAAVGNAIGGVALVTILRLVQVGRQKLAEERAREPGAAPVRDR
jgi:formate/nitrite transporter FocA (FNT family)